MYAIRSYYGLELYHEHRLRGQHLVEVIVSHSSHLIGRTIKEAQFRHRITSYNVCYTKLLRIPVGQPDT